MNLNIKFLTHFIKNTAILLGVFLCFAGSVQAKTITTYAKALENFSTIKPARTYKIELLESIMMFDGSFINGGSIITGDVICVQKPKRGKRDSEFEIIPTSVSYNGHEEKIKNANYTIMLSEYSPLDKKQVASAVARNTLGIVFHGAAQGISFVQGASQAPEGQKLKSGIHRVYTDSFISYVGKGKYIMVKTGDNLMLKMEEIKN